MDELDISKLMYAYAREIPPKVINRISPSQLGGCMRAHFYSIKHAPVTTPTNPGYILNMQSGFLWEKHVADSIRHARLPFIEQWKMVSDTYNMEGTLDFALVGANGELEIVDSKTESSLAYKYRHGSYLDSHEDYVHQLNCYALMAREYGFKVERGRFIVIRRDDSFIEDVPFMFDELRLEQTKQRIAELQAHLDNNTLPPCDGKFCNAQGPLGLCSFGQPSTRKENSKGKMVNTACCPVPTVLKQWSEEVPA